MSTTGEDQFRVWAWNDLSDAGREAYIQTMAVSYLRDRGRLVPDDLVSSRLLALRSWLEETRSGRASAQLSVAPTPYLEASALPRRARLSSEDHAVIRLDIADTWTALSPARRRLLVLRLAIAYVSEDYGGAVPSGLVEEAVAAAQGLAC